MCIMLDEQLHHIHDGHVLLLYEPVHLNPDDDQLRVYNLYLIQPLITFCQDMLENV